MNKNMIWRIGLYVVLIVLIIFYFDLLNQDHPEIQSVLFLPAVIIVLGALLYDQFFPKQDPRRRKKDSL
ncbi:MAG: hypothetical protein EOP46_19680 [Sphingobacteriaceae bacterium]|nr:MAG: hypothetical protein EOP46_19680 [Sphingobacteriaceae bacterium]